MTQFKRHLSAATLALFASLAATALAAHEFWIHPEAYRIAPGDEMRAALRVGETFEGSSQSYLPRNFKRFDLLCNGDAAPVDGRAGDRPALAVTVERDGLCVIVHQTRDYRLTYRKWEKFINFVTHKDFDGVLDTHAARGLPQEDFVELYSRYGKSLVAVGAGAGADSEVGLLTEIVAEANPYTDDLKNGLPVRVLFEGAPRPDAQVELFERAPDGSVEVTLHRTDADGRSILPVRAGYEYLVDAVVLRPLEPVEEDDPVWESLWASLTFKVPEP